MESKQTAVEWLMEQITYDNDGKRLPSFIETYDLSKFLEEAKQIEKEQEYETKAYWFGRGVLAGKENKIEELKPTKDGEQENKL
jgi:dissimilatory sulfite reductase (desulfoviridin) alpha/beta subunit